MTTTCRRFLATFSAASRIAPLVAVSLALAASVHAQFVDPNARLQRKMDALSGLSGLFFGAVGITNACAKRHPELKDEAREVGKKYASSNAELLKRASYNVADSIKTLDAKDYWPAYNHVLSKEVVARAEQKMAEAYPDLESCRVGLAGVAGGLSDLSSRGADLLTTILGDSWKAK